MAHHGLNHQHLHQLPVGSISCSISTKKDSVLHSVPDSTCLEYLCRNGVPLNHWYLNTRVYMWQPATNQCAQVQITLTSFPGPTHPICCVASTMFTSLTGTLSHDFLFPPHPPRIYLTPKTNTHCLLDELPNSLKYDFFLPSLGGFRRI